MTRFLSFLNRRTGTGIRRLASHCRAIQPRTFRPRLEVLEDRQLLSTFTVVLATDNGGPGGQMVTATTGDLRYCGEQADAKHSATSDSIGFSSALTSSPTTITLSSGNGPLVLSDGHPLTIDGAGAISVSGGGQVEVFNVAATTAYGPHGPTGAVTINNLAIINGFAANGGGISNSGTLTLANCLLDHDSANSTSGNGGGINNGGSLTLTNCTLSNDSAYGGGGLYNGGTVQINTCTYNLDSASFGGGIFAGGYEGSVTMTNSTLSNDSATTSGGGLFMQARVTVSLTNCTVNNDSALNGGGMYLTGNGFGASGYTLTNCTIAGNSAGSSGGGIYHFTGYKGKLINCTLSQNSAQTGGGIFIYYYGPGLINTIVAGNTATSSGPDISGSVGTYYPADHNLIGNATGSSGVTNGVNGNLVGGNGNPVINPMLGPLQNNGGPTQTMALLPGSPAIAAADNSQAPATDQRGFTRIDQAGETTDIGAFEVQGTMSLSAALTTSLDLTPSSARAIGLPNSSSWSQSSVALPSVANSTKKDVAVLIPRSHASVGPTDWAQPFLASESWRANSWLSL